MNVITAFEMTSQDVENVLRDYAMRINDMRGMSFHDLAEDLMKDIDAQRVAKAALRGGDDLDEQAIAAMDEIKKILVEIGVLEF